MLTTNSTVSLSRFNSNLLLFVLQDFLLDPGDLCYLFSKAVTSLASSTDGLLLVSGSEDGHVRVWDTRSQQVTRKFKHSQGSLFIFRTRSFSLQTCLTCILHYHGLWSLYFIYFFFLERENLIFTCGCDCKVETLLCEKQTRSPAKKGNKMIFNVGTLHRLTRV
jgi:WD40 repeat protein